MSTTLSGPIQETRLRHRIIWSADVDEASLRQLVLQMPSLTTVKLDRLFIDSYGSGVIEWLHEQGLRIFLDLKISEIPSKLAAIASVHLKHRPFMLNCMAGCLSSDQGSEGETEKQDGLKRFADQCAAVGTRSCAVTVLTSKTPAVVQAEYGRPPVEQVLFYLEKLLAYGFTDVVCSPQEVAAIRAESRFDHLALNVPGIRPPGSDLRDQARVATPAAALAAGATRLVIGQPITQGNPGQNLENILASIS